MMMPISYMRCSSLIGVLSAALMGWSGSAFGAVEQARPKGGQVTFQTLPDGTRIKVVKLPADGSKAPAPTAPARISAKPIGQKSDPAGPAGSSGSSAASGPAKGPGDPSKAASPPMAAGAPSTDASPVADGDPSEAQKGPAAPFDAKKYAALLRDKLSALKEKVVDKIEKKLITTQERRLQMVGNILGYVGFAGILLLLLPLFLRKRYPGKGWILFKYSAVATVTFFFSVMLFSMVLMLLRSVQAQLAPYTNPQVAMVKASLDALKDNAKHLVELGPVFVEKPLQEMENGEQSSAVIAIMDNVIHLQSALKKDLSVIKRVASFMKGFTRVSAFLPIVLTLVTVLLFLLSIKPVIMEIVSLPVRAARGEVDAKATVKEVFRKVGREFLATLGLILVFVAVTLLSGFLLSLVMRPAAEAFLAYLFTSLIYLLVVKGASTTWVYLSLGGTVLFLVTTMAIILVASVLYLSKCQKILRQRFQDKVPFKKHKRFWTWCTLGLAWALVLPYLYILAAQPAIGKIVDWLTASKEIKWVALLVSGPAILFVAFLLLFWLAQGVRAIKSIVKYEVDAAPADQAAAAGEAVEAGARTI